MADWKIEENISETELERCFKHTVDRSWFSRAWILQEVALARETILHLGPKSFHWEFLDLTLTALAFLHRKRTGLIDSSWVFKTEAYRTINNIRFCRGLWTSARMHHERGQFLNILLRLAKTVQCKDPRDRVFAFLSLQASNGPLLPPADYKLSRNQVYCRTSANLSELTGNLNIFGLVQRTAIHGIHPIGTRLPTWAIDWQYGDDSQGSPLTIFGPGYRACNKFQYVPTQKHIDSPILVVKGKVIDMIGAISRLNKSIVFDNSFLENLKCLTKENLLAKCFTLYEEIGAEIPKDKDQLYIRAAKVSVAYDPSRDDELCDWGNGLEQTIHNAYRSLQMKDSEQRVAEKAGRVLMTDYESRMHLFRLEPDDAQQRRAEESYRLRMLRSATQRVRKRSLCLSQESLLLGMVPWISKPGDSICILHGSSVPVVLRKLNNGHFTVVGQCYFEDWMFGEHVDWAEHQADDFELT
jgi:hypothetical protein